MFDLGGLIGAIVGVMILAGYRMVLGSGEQRDSTLPGLRNQALRPQVAELTALADCLNASARRRPRGAAPRER